MNSAHHHEHQDVITIIATSKESFDDAVKQGINQLIDPHGHHKDLKFTAYEVVQMQGTINHTDTVCEPMDYQVVMNVTGSHKHDH